MEFFGLGGSDRFGEADHIALTHCISVLYELQNGSYIPWLDQDEMR